MIITLMIITSQLNYQAFLANHWIVLLLAVICAVTPDMASPLCVFLVTEIEVFQVSELIAVAILFSLLLLRILLLQTAGYDRYQKKVIDQLTTQSEVLADRGNIYDINGVPLATNITTYRVFISPSSIADEQREKDQNGENIQLDEMIASKLSELLNVSYDFVMAETERTR